LTFTIFVGLYVGLEGKPESKGQQMPLSDAAVRNAKPRELLHKLSDGGGLQLWITPSGSKLWRLAYRFADKQKKLSIGPYPAIGLADARERREAAKAQLAAGIDPGQQKKFDRLASTASQASTFEIIAAELLAKKRKEGKASNTIGKREWLYSLAGKTFVERPISEITAPEILAVLRKVENKGHHETAHRLRSAIGEVFRYGIATARASADPTAALRGALTIPVVKHRAAITDPEGLGGLMRSIDAFNGHPVTVAALNLMALLFPRPGELRLADWTEFDLANAVWTIPATRAKMRREHRVPLPRQAIEILEKLRLLTGEDEFVFPGLHSRKRPLSENTMNVALRRMGYSQDEATSHGFRATASSLLNESGKWSPDVIERALGHQDPDEVRRAYARGEHWKERVSMNQWWADHLDTLRDGRAAVVVPMVRPA
jgi:integrase